MKAMAFQPALRRQKGGAQFHGQLDIDGSSTKPALCNEHHRHRFQSHLELSLGISSNSSAANTFSLAASSGDSGLSAAVKDVNLAAAWLHSKERAVTEEGYRWPQALPTEHDDHQIIHNTGFIHPWSLAARQFQKAALEQAHQEHFNSSSRSSSCSMAKPTGYLPSLMSVFGWLPASGYRNNLGSNVTTSLNLLKQEVLLNENTYRAKRPKLMETTKKGDEARCAIYVKVNMEGYAMGRKIDLNAHQSYASLSLAIAKLFHDFLSVDCLNNSENHKQGEEALHEDFILLYEDNEGDQMLVGDIPWELFITSVKKLYIARNPKRDVRGGEAKQSNLPQANKRLETENM